MSEIFSVLEEHITNDETCTCIVQVQKGWKQIQSMAMVNLDDIIVATTQTIAFSRNAHMCPSRCALLMAEVKKALLQIYQRLVDMLRNVLDVYTAAPSATTRHTTQRLADNLHCVPSIMSLGIHDLDQQQSQYLALNLVCRTSRNLACVLEPMGEVEGEAAGIAAIDARVLGLSARITRLVEEASGALLTASKT